MILSVLIRNIKSPLRRAPGAAFREKAMDAFSSLSDSIKSMTGKNDAVNDAVVKWHSCVLVVNDQYLVLRSFTHQGSQAGATYHKSKLLAALLHLLQLYKTSVVNTKRGETVTQGMISLWKYL